VSSPDDLQRIARALTQARAILRRFTPGSVEFRSKAGGDPVTEADRLVDECLRRNLQEEGEGWLSEETADDKSRLGCRRAWIVDPLDGTKEFVAGIPEWCVSVGLVEDGRPVAGGVCNPILDQVFLGSSSAGVTLNGKAVSATPRRELSGALVLASRSETKRGEWERFRGAPFTVQAMGSVAYKLALVAAGLADATWTLVPKHEWDVAAGVALVEAAGGFVRTLDGAIPIFNQENPRLRGLLAATNGLGIGVARFLEVPVRDLAQLGRE
jgi:myo-inositol-1(or 4)-monophosphatase